MILTPIAIDDMPKAIAAFDAHLDGHAQARAAFRRIAFRSCGRSTRARGTT